MFIYDDSPLATLQAFNGWADIFLTTPLNGLVDTSYSLGYGTDLGGHPLVLRILYHRFESNSAGIDFGTEWYILAQFELCEECTLLIKYAAYGAHDYASETRKFWTSFQYRF